MQIEGSGPSSGPEFDNCEVLHDTLQLSWKVDSDNSQVRFQLCGCTSSNAEYVQLCQCTYSKINDYTLYIVKFTLHNKHYVFVSIPTSSYVNSMIMRKQL